MCGCAGVAGSEWNLAVHLCLNSNIDMRTLGVGVQAGQGVASYGDNVFFQAKCS